MKMQFNELGVPPAIFNRNRHKGLVEPGSLAGKPMAVTVTFLNPVAGAVAPTAAQSLNTDRVSADIIASADGDTTATLTHNFGLSAASLSAGNPLVMMVPLLQASAGLSLWAITSHLTNTVVATKSVAVGSGNAGAQLRLHVLRHSFLD